MKDYYKVLGLEKTATAEDIKNAYRRLAKKYHPDVSTEENATELFQELQEAYSVLKDPTKKEQYDLGGNPHSRDRVHQYYHASSRDPFVNIHDLFEALRGQQPRQRQTIYQVAISLEEAFRGTLRTINGTAFRIPPGLRTGNRLTVENFLVDVVVVPHERFKRAGDDLLLHATVSAPEAMVGTKLKVAHIDGTTLICDLPAGTQPGQVMRLKGKGMPNPEVAAIGDLLIQVTITIPTLLTDEQKERIMSLAPRPEINV